MSIDTCHQIFSCRCFPKRSRTLNKCDPSNFDKRGGFLDTLQCLTEIGSLEIKDNRKLFSSSLLLSFPPLLSLTHSSPSLFLPFCLNRMSRCVQSEVCVPLCGCCFPSRKAADSRDRSLTLRIFCFYFLSLFLFCFFFFLVSSRSPSPSVRSLMM